MFSVVAAVASDQAIGQCGTLPWPHLVRDMQWFAWLTRAVDPLTCALSIIDDPLHTTPCLRSDTNTLLMGRVTSASLPRALSYRCTIVLSTSSMPLERALSCATGHVFCVGGVGVFAEALIHGACARLYLTEIDEVYRQADRHFPWTILDNGVCYATDRQRSIVWKRQYSSVWVHEVDCPRYRFTIWKQVWRR